MATAEQKQKIFKAKVAVAVCDVLGRVPKNEEFDRIRIFSRAICKAVPDLHRQRKAQTKQR
jgi:hypothetical protein